LRPNWSIRNGEDEIEQAVERYRRYLENKGFRPTTIGVYSANLRLYLKFAGTDRPSENDLKAFRESLFDRQVSRSTHNNYKSCITEYHKMFGEKVDIPFLPMNETLPYFFSQEEVYRIFASIHNLKHLCMFQVLFYGCLRASELCNLDDDDLDLKNLTVRVRQGKGGRDGYGFITDECARYLKQYLSIRPSLKIDGRQPLFYSDFGNRYDRDSLYRIFCYCKERAGIEKKGGLHVFGRHSSATLMTAKGVPLNVIQVLLRHKDVRSTLRYAHVNNAVARQWYNKTMRFE
jgi:integrase/recombinase XerD